MMTGNDDTVVRAGSVPVRVVPVSTTPSPRLLRACALFGILVTESRRACRARQRQADACAVQLLRRLKGGQIALVAGPSGAGKSTVLDSLSRCAARRGAVVLRPDAVGRPATRTVRTRGSTAGRGGGGLIRPDRSVVDQFAGPLREVLRLLASIGLADATLLPRTPQELSAGERCRLELALALHRAARHVARRRSGPVTVVVDEFVSCLDRPTARGVAAGFRRCVSAMQPRVRAVCATAHDDLLDAVRPDVVVRCELEAEPQLELRHG